MKNGISFILVLSIIATSTAQAEVPKTEGFRYYQEHAYDITLALCKPNFDIISVVAPIAGPAGEIVSLVRSKQKQEAYRLMWNAATDALSAEMDFTSLSKAICSENNSAKKAALNVRDFLNNDFSFTRLSPEFVGLVSSEGYKKALTECYGNSTFKKASFENTLAIADGVAKGLVIAGMIKLPLVLKGAEKKVLATKFAMDHPQLMAKPITGITKVLKFTDGAFKYSAGMLPMAMAGSIAGLIFDNSNQQKNHGEVFGGAAGGLLGWAATYFFGWWGASASLATAATTTAVLNCNTAPPATEPNTDERSIEALVGTVKIGKILLKSYQADLQRLQAEKAVNPGREKIDEEIQKAQYSVISTKETLDSLCATEQLKNTQECLTR